MYGLECCSLTSKNIDILEATHYQSARRLQGLPRQMSLVVPLATSGWLSIRSMLHIAQLLTVTNPSPISLTCYVFYEATSYRETNVPQHWKTQWATM